MKRRPERLWLCLVLIGAALEAWGVKRRQTTISSLTRRIFAVHTAPGRIAFVFSWAALTAWFVPHVLSETERP